MCVCVPARASPTLQWVTPLGLPVTQPYFKESNKSVRTGIQVGLFTCYLIVYQKRPNCIPKETYLYTKRDLLVYQKRPNPTRPCAQ